MSAAFADRLIARARTFGAALCVGLDPYVARIPPAFGASDPARKAEDFCTAVIETTGPWAVAFKLQIALFEPLDGGYAAACRVAAAAKASGALVILDAKRGDIGATAEGYAEAAFGPRFAADAVTVNPYMGMDSLEPFLARAAATRKGVAALVRTSNPGAADFQDLDCGGAPLWSRVADRLAQHAHRLDGSLGWSGLMAVVGATQPAEARRARAHLPRSLFLVPGFGAQGGDASDAVAGFLPGPAGLEGGVVNASRAVLFPAAADATASIAVWRDAVGSAARDAFDALKSAAEVR